MARKNNGKGNMSIFDVFCPKKVEKTENEKPKPKKRKKRAKSKRKSVVMIPHEKN